MLRIAWLSSLALAALLALLAPGRAAAQTVVVSQPAVVYSPPPAVTCYSPPTVYTPAPVVSYYAAPAVTYYAAPSVSYYTAPTAVTTTRYGLLGRPRATVTRYYP